MSATKRLTDKVAVIYGNGAVGAAIAESFTQQGAKVFLAGRTANKMSAIAAKIASQGHTIETALVDALDEKAIEGFVSDVVRKAGKIDISFNTIGIPQKGIQGIALADLSLESFFNPIKTYVQSHFLTAKAATWEMVKQGSGVILMHVPNASHISPPFVGGMVPAWSAVEALCRSLSVEYGQLGIRSVCLLSTGIPETPLIDEVWEIHGKAHNISFAQFHNMMENATHRKRLTSLRELGDAAVFLASEESSAISGTILNLTAGMIV
ncbi:MAG TPA: SDR family oxidoreductase [Chitinophagaceae bacterium]|nr:SDR family oxidoreductase [Chitinophagaceae bacterium]